MRYIIETTEDGCVETLEMNDGQKFSDRWVKSFGKYETTGPSLEMQLEDAGYDDEVLEKAQDIFDGLSACDFIDLADLIKRFS